MIVADGFYSIPLLPKETADRIKALPKADWPSDLRKEYDLHHKKFSASKAEFASWIRKDRDSRMNRTAKLILMFILESLNFDTGRCDPGHECIADELDISVRTVERTIPRIAASGWISITRRGKTTTNFYRMQVASAKVAAILDYADSLRDQREERREKRRTAWRQGMSDPTKVADHSHSDPTTVRSHDPTELAAHDPTELAGKPMNRTFEEEPLNKSSCSEGREDTYPRDVIPTEERDFGIWIKIQRNIVTRSACCVSGR